VSAGTVAGGAVVAIEESSASAVSAIAEEGKKDL